MFSFRTTPLEDQLDKALREGKVGCFCTQNCWDTARTRWMYDIFRSRGNLEVVFTPRDAELTPGTNHIDFDLERLSGLNAVVVEIQDVGVRYFNYTKDVMRLMEMLLLLGEDAPSLYVVDHINPSGRVVEGTIPSVVGEMFVPKVAHRHGLTLGELVNLCCRGPSRPPPTSPDCSAPTYTAEEGCGTIRQSPPVSARPVLTSTLARPSCIRDFPWTFPSWKAP